MDMLVKNAPNFRKQLNDASLASAVVKTLPKSVRNPQGKRFVNLDKNSVVKSEKINKTLLLIQRWATVLSKWKEAYDELVGRNCEFPEPLKDEISPLDFCDEKVPAPKPHEFADKDCRSVVEVFTLLKDMIRAEKAAPKNTVSEPAVNRKLSQEQLSRMSFEQIMSYTLEQSFVQAKLDKDNRNRNSKTLAKDPVINHLMGEVARLESLLQERIGTEALDYEEVAEIMQCLEMLKQIRVLYSSVVANDKAISETTSTALSNPALPGFREDVKKSKTRTTGGVKRTSKDVKSTAGYRTNREPQASAPVPTVDLLEFVFDRQESGESDIDENLFHRENNRSQRSR
uniref:VHS domain-containing protein n=1 Tax=Lotharella globosa TaxID=91324 RepID=A0A6V3P6R8_9EUKA|mmetsp:Transcript_12631/g.25760  ORF Transcript_12631/g.25760 Transcript_12631/m.25760 type:complete len:343 (-) Transcript_12631:216-1244(-)